MNNNLKRISNIDHKIISTKLSICSICNKEKLCGNFLISRCEYASLISYKISTCLLKIEEKNKTSPD